MNQAPVKVLVWFEGQHPGDIYPQRIHGAIAQVLNESEQITAWIAELLNPQQGIVQSVLADIDVLVWWGHRLHNEVSDETVRRVVERVEEGMGFMPIHSAHHSKPFQALMGTSCDLGSWREEAEPEYLTTLLPDHPIAQGIPAQWDVPHTEMYSEPFDVPEPDEVIFHSCWDRGEEFRSGCTWTRGAGRIFYFRPGHESYEIFTRPVVQQVIINGVLWCAKRT